MFSENIATEMFSAPPSYEQKVDEVAREFLEDLQNEQNRLKEYFPICNRLIEDAYDRFYTWGEIPGHDNFADIIKLKPMKLVQRVSVPVQEYSHLDLNQKILNLKENVLEELENETHCQICVKGRNSMSDEAGEEELRLSKDPRFLHLNKNLFLEITTEATAIECHTRIAYALAEIRKYFLTPTNEVINETQPTDLESGNIEYIKIERLEEPSIDIDIKEPPQLSPAKILDTKSETSESNNTNPLDINLADKVIKLLDETVLNPQYKNSAINKIEPETATDPINISLDNDIENVMPTTSAASRSKLIKKKSSGEKLAVKVKRIVKRRISKDSIKAKSIKMKMDKLRAIKKKNFEETTKNKKQKYPAIFYMKDTKTDKIVKRKLANKSSLSEILKRSTNKETNKQEYCDISDEEYQTLTIEYLQQHPQELVFELTPSEIVLSLIEAMRMYPVLWEYHEEAYNEDYSKAIEYLCELMREKWLLNINHLQMCRSINRILRFYRFLFPFDVIDNFTDYFEKCASFLPAAVIDIPHARCFQCCRCFKRDRDLVSHMVAEHDNLGWPYKCLHCHESFATNDEFELHIHLPHYLEVFTCRECNQKFYSYYLFSQHPHQKLQLPCRYMCDICQKDFKNRSVLSNHKKIHKGVRYNCHLCPKIYHNKTTLNMHLRKHRMDLSCICDVCGKGFIQNKDLKAHMNVHTGFKITCNICNLQVTKNNLHRHLRTIHVVYAGTIENNFRAQGYRYKKGSRHKETGPRHYKCKICTIQFERCKELKAHNIECHSDMISKLPCKLCDSLLTKICNLKRHYRDKHKLTDNQINDIVKNNLDIKAVLAETSTQKMLINTEEEIEITTGWESPNEDLD